MLTKEQIVKALNDKEIEIAISFGFEDGNLVSYDTEKDFLNSPLKDNLYSDRLKLTMGPVIKVLNKKRVKAKYRFKTILDCHDLRNSNNKYIINPGESIIVLTNEKIKLNGKYACLVIPRISLSDVGVVVTTAYVDPFYHGVMRLHLSNLSDKSYELTALESIAQCFFFELSESVATEFQEQFSTKSVFFGQTWKGILESDRNPFPTKKQSAKIDKFSNLKYQLSIVWEFVKKHSLIFTLIANLAVIICGFVTFQQGITEYTATVDQVEDFLEPMASEIVINSGEFYGEKEVVVGYEKSDIVTVLCNNDQVHYKILSSDVENKAKIVFSYELESVATNKHEVNFTYVVIRRIK